MESAQEVILLLVGQLIDIQAGVAGIKGLLGGADGVDLLVIVSGPLVLICVDMHLLDIIVIAADIIGHGAKRSKLPGRTNLHLLAGGQVVLMGLAITTGVAAAVGVAVGEGVVIGTIHLRFGHIGVEVDGVGAALL